MQEKLETKARSISSPSPSPILDVSYEPHPEKEDYHRQVIIQKITWLYRYELPEGYTQMYCSVCSDVSTLFVRDPDKKLETLTIGEGEIVPEYYLEKVLAAAKVAAEKYEKIPPEKREAALNWKHRSKRYTIYLEG